MKHFPLSAVVVTLLMSSIPARAFDAESTEAWLKKFRADPRAMMDSLPPKSGPDIHVQPFGPQEIQGQSYIKIKDRVRADLISGPRAELGSNDRVERFLEGSEILRTPVEMESRGLTAAALPEAPWSDDYWPIYHGLLGARYADPSYSWSVNWKEAHDYVLAHPFADIVASGDSHRIDQLSPSEKYDLVAGYGGDRLTRSMWKEGQKYYDANGEVETWMGICHGWSPASYLAPRPRHAITVMAADGKTPVGSETGMVLFTPEGHEDRIGGFMNLSFTCDNIQKTYQALKDRGVEFLGPPKIEDWGSHAIFQDLDGNKFNISSR